MFLCLGRVSQREACTCIYTHSPHLRMAQLNNFVILWWYLSVSITTASGPEGPSGMHCAVLSWRLIWCSHIFCLWHSQFRMCMVRMSSQYTYHSLKAVCQEASIPNSKIPTTLKEILSSVRLYRKVRSQIKAHWWSQQGSSLFAGIASEHQGSFTYMISIREGLVKAPGDFHCLWVTHHPCPWRTSLRAVLRSVS